jgi:hypothetical protein
MAALPSFAKQTSRGAQRRTRIECTRVDPAKATGTPELADIGDALKLDDT